MLCSAIVRASRIIIQVYIVAVLNFHQCSKSIIFKTLIKIAVIILTSKVHTVILAMYMHIAKYELNFHMYNQQ